MRRGLYGLLALVSPFEKEVYLIYLPEVSEERIGRCQGVRLGPGSILELGQIPLGRLYFRGCHL